MKPMRIAFISYEYPPDTADGGIATYVWQAARMLADRGHEIEVFAASRDREGIEDEAGVRVHRMLALNRLEFPEHIAEPFRLRHRERPFDVIEGTDYNAEAAHAVEAVPEIPLVLRLHTPRYLANWLNGLSKSPHTFREWEVLLASERHAPADDPEYIHVQRADVISAPSAAIRTLVGTDWGLDTAQIVVLPNVYEPEPSLLALPVEASARLVTYIGRLEGRKGVIDFANAIPAILRRCPDARFRFVGRPMLSPEPESDMQQYLQHRLAPYRESVEFVGQVPRTALPEVLGPAAICVFPSLWENFPYTCLEAMAAGRGVVGSRAGGMAEMLTEGTGLLVSPGHPDSIATAVCELLQDDTLRLRLGTAARTRVLEAYSAEHLAPQQEAIYRLAIQRRSQSTRGRA